MDVGVGVDGVELDLLDAGGGGGGGGGVQGAFVVEFGDAGADAGVGGGDVVEEDLAGLVGGGADAVAESRGSVMWDGQVDGWVGGLGNGSCGTYRLKNKPTPSLPRERQYCSSSAWCTHCLA